jgi:zinc protease
MRNLRSTFQPFRLRASGPPSARPSSASSSRAKSQTTKVITLTLCFVVIPLVLLVLAIRPAGAADGMGPGVPASGTVSASSTASGAKHYKDLKLPPLPEIKIPDYSRYQLSNGMVVYLMEDHELPLIQGTALIRTGERLEPGDQVGLADLVGTVMRSGGTPTTPPDAINQRLEQKAASIETGIDLASGGASFSLLKEDIGEILPLFAEILRSPQFPEDKLDLAKTQVKGGIARRNDEAGGITRREFRKLMYGAASPYARTVEYSSLDRIGRSDLLRFYQQAIQPQQVILGVLGDFKTSEMRRLIETSFGNWQSTAPAAATATLPAVTQAKTSGIYLVDKPDQTQSNVRIGHLAGTMRSPDYPALSVMNEVLNGFGGRLFNEVRSRQGLAYSVYGFWAAQMDYPGLFIAGGETRSEATGQFINSLKAEINRIRTQPITAAELQGAKDTVLNSFIFNFQDGSSTLSRLMQYEYFGYPKDFIFTYRRAVEQTTIADVQRVAQKYLQPDQLVTLVVGNAKDVKPAIAQLNPGSEVIPIDITIPQPNP